MPSIFSSEYIIPILRKRGFVEVGQIRSIVRQAGLKLEDFE